MNQANGEKVDVERQQTGTLNSGYLPILNEKQPLVEERQSKMPSLKRFLFTLLAISIFAVTFCSANGVRVPRSPSPRDQRKFQELLNSIEPSSLNEAFHDHLDKYKHGLYQEDKTAVAVIHQKTPEAASSLVVLAKRQEGSSSNGTGIVTSTTATTTEATSTVTTPFTSTSVVTTTSNTPPSSTTEESTTPTPTSTTSDPTSGTSSSESSTVTKTDTTPTSTPEGTPTPSDTGSNSSNPPPPSTSITSYDIYTTTLPNGSPTTITQITVVPAGGLPDQTGSGGSKTNPSASLQTNGAGARELGPNVVMGIIGMLFLAVL